MGMELESTTVEADLTRKQRFFRLLQKAATKVIEEGDPWGQYKLQDIPAERVIRHLYNPATQTWWTDETIVKMEREAFTCGAMRYCYRMKKRAQPPKTSTNHRFHKFGWSYASNYVAKAYHIDGKIDTSDEAKRAVQNDIRLQYEAQYWAEKFNEVDPPSKIAFLRAYAIEFPDREGQPWLAVERFISGTDRYGAGFVKHNTNSGYVDQELRRVTPQVFSAFSFYKSEGQRLVADIQGVGDLYTDPQVLSNDYRFGDGDLGPRGMALFFKNFRHCSLSDSVGIPVFPLSRNELKHQAKYEEDEETLSDDELSLEGMLCHFRKLDENRIQRRTMLLSPKDLLSPDLQDTEKRANFAVDRADLRKSLRQSLIKPPKLNRTTSDVDEVTVCLRRAKNDLSYSHKDFHRRSSGELRERQYKSGANSADGPRRTSMMPRKVCPIMVPTEETKKNLGKVHYQLAVLHGMDRFPEIVPEGDNKPDHDSFSVVFHLSYAAALQNAPACLALARVQSGLDSSVSRLLNLIIPTDFESAKDLLRRAMSSPYPPAAPKASAGCLLYQILQDEADVADEKTALSDAIMIQVLYDTISLMEQAHQEMAEATKHKDKVKTVGCFSFQKGDRVEADYSLEGTYYPGTVENVDGDQITVRYDDDGSCETLTTEHVRLLIPPTATQTVSGGPLTDEEAFGDDDMSEDEFRLEMYELQAELAELLEHNGRAAEAATLYEQAADGAMAAGKMKTASEWSYKASSLQP